jgi:PhoPQ-activated pathogenicity-related protein
MRGSLRRISGHRRLRSATGDWYSLRFEVLESRNLLSVAALFYNNSIWDDPGFGFDNASAIATDKSAYIPGGPGTSTFASMSSYDKGINGIMVELAQPHGTVTAGDFTIRMSPQTLGANNAPGSWAAAPAFSVTLVPDTPTTGTDRYELVWADGAIVNRYLYVLVEGNDALGGFNTNTGLAASEVFFFGNMVGDAGSPETFPNVDALDQIQARTNQGTALPPGGVANLYDFNRDALVDASDQIIARNNQTAMPWLEFSTSGPALSAELLHDTGPNGIDNSDGITTNPTISGTLSAANGLAAFRVGLNAAPATTDALALLTGGNFTLTQSFLQGLNGGPLADGPYVVHLLAVDHVGLVTTLDVSFTLKTSITPPAIPDLIPADDSGISASDDITNNIAPRIEVTAETGSLVQLFVNNVLRASGTAAPGLQFNVLLGADGDYDYHVVSQDGAGNSAMSPTLTVTLATAAPTISATTLVTISSDLTPHVNVEAASGLGLPDGTQITIDVDLNYDGTFAGAGELDRTTSTLYAGKSFFQVTPALPADVGGAAYLVQLRARVTDIAGNEGTSTPTSLKIDRIPNSVLQAYVSATDPDYSYSQFGGTFNGTGYKAYNLDLKSQRWRSLTEVNKTLWQHWVQLYVPTTVTTNTATLLIDGGSNSGSPPSYDVNLGALAVATGSVLVRLRNVPNEPLTFTDEGFPRTEDEIIAYTFDKYANNLGAPGNDTWPLLLPMVKSARAAMTAADDFAEDLTPSVQINDFLVTGGSKRGWTTWLTAAMDNRVRAIVPGVIDILNMGEQMVHHYGAYADFSYAIDDYTAFNIPQEAYTAGGQEVGRVVDPFMYIYNGRFDNMPKLLINSTGDEFFLPDGAEFYFSDLPGSDNFLRYIPNTSHSLNSIDPAISTVAFFSDVVSGTPLPEFSWTVGQDGSITVQTTTTPIQVSLWQATNPAARDFRKPIYPSITWTSSTLPPQSPNTYVASVATPGSGATGFFVELIFPSSKPGYNHVFTTQIKIATDLPLTDWAFFMPTNPPPGPLPGGEGDSGAPTADAADAVAAALARSADADTSSDSPAAQHVSTSPSVAAAPAGAEEVDLIVTGDWSWADDDDDEAPPDDDDELALVLLDDDWL